MAWDINWATWVTGGVGAVATIVGILMGKKEKAPRYALENDNLFEKLPDLVPDLKVEYKGEQIANLTITKVRFWNAGRDTINGTDVVQPIVIETQGDCKIISANVIRVNQVANKFECSPVPPDGSRVTISFDYLDKNEGALVQIAHTGTGKKSIKLTGRVKQAGVPRQVFYPSARSARSVRPISRGKRLRAVAGVIIAPLILWGVFFGMLATHERTSDSDLIGIIAFGLFCTILTAFCWFLGYLVLFWGFVPKDLE